MTYLLIACLGVWVLTPPTRSTGRTDPRWRKKLVRTVSPEPGLSCALRSGQAPPTKAAA